MSIDDKSFQRIKDVYFTNPDRIVHLKAGEILLEQGKKNDRLYLILSGLIIGYQSIDGEKVEIFRSGSDTFIGLQSFFSRPHDSYAEAVADIDCILAYIDPSIPAVDDEEYGSLIEQFNPVIVNALVNRQLRSSRAAVERQRTHRRLIQAEKMSTLGQLSAGLAHELNNSIGVLARKSEYIGEYFENYLRQTNLCQFSFFSSGLKNGQIVSTAETRAKTKEFEKKLNLNREDAKQLAKMAGSLSDERLQDKKVLANLAEISKIWQLGVDFHDMQIAAQHATGIVKSVKILGGGDFERVENVSISTSIEQAISLLKSDLRTVTFDLFGDELPNIYGNTTELIQVWVNIIKNACDAMDIANHR